MKKVSQLALIGLLSFTLTTGCTQQPSKAASNEPIILNDGIYTTAGEIESGDWIPEISLTINNGKITDVKYNETASLRKSNSIEYQNNFKAQTKLDLLSIYNTLQNSLIETQDPLKLDVVAGATIASTNIKNLAAEALNNAKRDTKYIDGDYTAKGSIDEKYWTPILTITVKNEKIAIVKYDEISSKVFKHKSQDIAYIADYKEKNNIDLIEVYDSLEKSLIEKQDPTSLDAIAGATTTSTNFIEIAKKAIEKAK
ncbi:MAG: FMN-binding domain protein [Clostridia bacterium]|jgi:major membrane immunogen (membrane-anchored lipoprotein)|nr:FMN-binding domain protein [Clostridia bacterium]